MNAYRFLWLSTKGKRSILFILILLNSLESITYTFISQFFNKKLVNYLNSKDIIFSKGLQFLLLYILFDNIGWLIMAVIAKLRFFSIFRIQYRIRNNLFDYLTKHSMNYFNNSFSGALNNKIMITAKNSGAIIETIRRFASKIICIFLTPIFFAQMNLCLGFFMIIVPIAYVFISKNIKENIRKKSKELAEEKSKYFALMNDELTNIINIKAFSRIFKENIEIKKQNVNILRKELEFQRADAKYSFVKFVFAFTIHLVALGVGAYLLCKNKINIGDFLFLTITASILNYNIKAMSENISKFATQKGVFENNLNTIFQPIEINDSSSKKLAISNGKIVFKNMTFNYKDSKNE